MGEVLVDLLPCNVCGVPTEGRDRPGIALCAKCPRPEPFTHIVGARTIELRILGNGPLPVIRPNDFLRTRLKSGSRFYLVIDAETVPAKRAGSYPKERIVCFRATRAEWENREPDQATHWYGKQRRTMVRCPYCRKRTPGTNSKGRPFCSQCGGPL